MFCFRCFQHSNNESPVIYLWNGVTVTTHDDRITVDRPVSARTAGGVVGVLTWMIDGAGQFFLTIVAVHDLWYAAPCVSLLEMHFIIATLVYLACSFLSIVARAAFIDPGTKHERQRLVAECAQKSGRSLDIRDNAAMLTTLGCVGIIAIVIGHWMFMEDIVRTGVIMAVLGTLCTSWCQRRLEHNRAVLWDSASQFIASIHPLAAPEVAP